MSRLSRLWRTAAALGLAALLAATVGACRVAYVPSAEPSTVDAGNTDDGSLRRLVDVVPQGCSDEAAGGVVRNSSEYALRVVVQAGWNTIELEQVTGDATVEVPPGGETSFEVRAPDGASARFGCQVYATSVELAQ